MTNKEAIGQLEWYFEEDNGISADLVTKQAFNTIKMALSQEPTIQDKQAESEKYQKAFDDGYENGYAQARFDYKQEPCDAISRKEARKIISILYGRELCEIMYQINLLPSVYYESKYCPKCGAKMESGDKK